jgi:hypothetical protein
MWHCAADGELRHSGPLRPQEAAISSFSGQEGHMRRFIWLVLVLSFGLADWTVPAAAQSKPNGNGTLPPVIGSQHPPGGSATSRRNIFGGYDYTLPGGERITTRKNIFGGQDITLPGGRQITSRPNIFGGYDYSLPGGERISSRKNIFGGYDYYLPNGQRATSRPNIFGGYDYSLPGGGSATSRGNIFGGADYRRDRRP